MLKLGVARGLGCGKTDAGFLASTISWCLEGFSRVPLPRVSWCGGLGLIRASDLTVVFLLLGLSGFSAFGLELFEVFSSQESCLFFVRVCMLMV